VEALEANVCVVGAGYAGLTAALRIEQAGSSVVVLEARHLAREPVGRVHWAGTETSPVMNGFIDGAVRSGERAAAEVLAAEQSL
jgi:monoamine oxidase